MNIHKRKKFDDINRKNKSQLDELNCKMMTHGMKSEKGIAIKGIINNDYGNQAEIELKKLYEIRFKKMHLKKKLTPLSLSMQIDAKQREKRMKTELQRLTLQQSNQIEKNKIEQPKMTKYDHIPSLVKKGILLFKTYHPNTNDNTQIQAS